MAENIYVGKQLKSLHTGPNHGHYTGVILYLTSDHTSEKCVTAGDDSGKVMEAECPWATQAIADNVLAALTGVEYTPYEGSNVLLDPAAEIGDYVTAANVFTGIYTLDRKFGKTSSSNISAPQTTEEDHEIQAKDVAERRFVRSMKQMRAEFAILADEISAQVSERVPIEGDNGKTGEQKFSWSLKSTGMTWYANDSPVMNVDENGLTIWGQTKTNKLYIGGLEIDAGVLRGGALDGYNWENGTVKYGGVTYKKPAFTVNGGAYGYNYDSASTQNTLRYPIWFTCGNLRVTGNGGSGYTFNQGVTFTVGTKTYCCLGYEVTSGN